MPQRHSKNNNDLAFFTYEEKRKLGYGTQRERLGKDSIKPFDACCLCLKPLIDPLCCPKGHAFCKECILECLLAQKKDIKRKLAAHEAQKKLEKEEEEEKLMLQKSKELDAFDQQNHGAVPQYHDRNDSEDKNGFHGANSVKVTSFEEEALRNMKAFWLPSATPEASAKVEAPSTDTICPEGQEKLKLKSLFPISFTEEKTDQKSKRGNGRPAELDLFRIQTDVRRRLALLGAGALATGLLKSSSAYAEGMIPEVPKNYKSYVDANDGYSYLYPSDWRDFDFLGHDSAFKDRNVALQCVRVGFIPTTKTDIRDLGPMDEAIFNLVNNVYAAPNQIPTVYDMQERTVDGKNYWTFEYDLEAPGYGVSAFATVAIGNGRYYTLIVTANGRRWSRLRNRLKVVAESFKLSELSA
uniref:PsbP C-terminal domain-containing protein n=1 Tax=Leersia perrieri TaxID=77586 RepID=A0A0D9VSL1_9ORYZ